MNGDIEAIPRSILSVKMKDYRVKIDNAILAELNRYKGSSFYAPLAHAMKGGKRLRPILLMLSFESVGGRGLDPLPAAVAIELAHLESLIHDDIIDRDFLRRGKTAFHISNSGEVALLTADFILSMILEITSRYADPRIAQAFARAASRMCEGELEEYKVFKNKQVLSPSEYIHIMCEKTASLFEASSAIGAMIGGAVVGEVEALSDYGRSLGIAYQIQDDILDSKKTKTTKISFISKSDLEKCLKEMTSSYILRAKQSIKKLRTTEAKDLLIELADFINLYSTHKI